MMDNSVFISYRRSKSKWPVNLIASYLHNHGFDVFYDVKDLGAGRFKEVIFRQIQSRAHFIVVLAPGSLDRCCDPEDLFRQEIELAIQTERNIIPIFSDGFDFKDVKVDLTGVIKRIFDFNGLTIHDDYAEEGLEKLKSRFLKQGFSGKIIPLSEEQIMASQETIKIIVNQSSIGDINIHELQKATEEGIEKDNINNKTIIIQKYYFRLCGRIDDLLTDSIFAYGKSDQFFLFRLTKEDKQKLLAWIKRRKTHLSPIHQKSLLTSIILHSILRSRFKRKNTYSFDIGYYKHWNFLKSNLVNLLMNSGMKINPEKFIFEFKEKGDFLFNVARKGLRGELEVNYQIDYTNIIGELKK